MRGVIKKKGQVWIETVIYTLIGLAIIGIVLGVAKPQIDKKKNEIAIEQSIDTLQTIDMKLVEALVATGNQRVIELDIKKGTLFFDMTNDSIYWIIDSNFKYSEEGLPVSIGLFTVTTTKGGNDGWKVKIEKKYNIDLSFDGKTMGVKELTYASVPYNLVLENNRKNSDGKTVIDFRVG